MWRPYVVNVFTPTGARLGPHYLTLSTGHPAEEKCAPLAKSISAHLRHPRIAVYSMRDSLGKITPPLKKSRVGRPPTVVLPIGSTLEQIFWYNESSEIREIPEKAPILARREGGERESMTNFWSFFGPRLARRRN